MKYQESTDEVLNIVIIVSFFPAFLRVKGINYNQQTNDNKMEFINIFNILRLRINKRYFARDMAKKDMIVFVII